jgi:sigma-E factor negative regulatory protein RseC
MVKCTVMEEVGTIKSTDGLFAVVSVPRKNSCEGCSLNICKPDEQFMEIEALNAAKADVGQKVRVVMNSYSYMKSAGIVYGIPALALVLGAVAGKEIFSRYLPGFDPDIISAMFGFGGFILAFIVIRLWTERASKKTDSKPVIEEILE